MSWTAQGIYGCDYPGGPPGVTLFTGAWVRLGPACAAPDLRVGAVVRVEIEDRPAGAWPPRYVVRVEEVP